MKTKLTTSPKLPHAATYGAGPVARETASGAFLGKGGLDGREEGNGEDDEDRGVAEHLGVSIDTVRRYFKVGIRVRRGTRTVDVRLHAYHFGKQTLRFKPEDVRAFEEAAKEKE